MGQFFNKKVMNSSGKLGNLETQRKEFIEESKPKKMTNIEKAREALRIKREQSANS